MGGRVRPRRRGIRDAVPAARTCRLQPLLSAHRFWTIAEDSTSLTFLTAWRRRTDVRLARDSALPWLLAIATNVSQHQQRSARRARALTERLSADPPQVDHADDVAARLDDERRMAEVLRIVGRFPRAEREALALCVWSGVSYPDAAAALGLAESSVRARVSRARARLATYYPAETGPVASAPTSHKEDR